MVELEKGACRAPAAIGRDVRAPQTGAGAIGYGGLAAVARATGLAIGTVRKGRDEVRAGPGPDDVGNTTNRGGLVVRARLDRRRYATGKKVTDKEFRELKIEPDSFHGDWNYVIKPRKE